MSYRFLEHVTDAIIEINADNPAEAFKTAAYAMINLTLDQDSVQERFEKKITAHGENLHHLLFSWAEEINFALITEGFAIRRIELDTIIIIASSKGYRIDAVVYGEPIDLDKHNFKVEIKAPTFHDMQIMIGKEAMHQKDIHHTYDPSHNAKSTPTYNANGKTYMRFMLDL